MLLDRNPNADAADNKGYTPLHNAAQFAGLPEVSVLVQRGGADVSAETKQSQTPLHLACYKPRVKVVEYLLARLGEAANFIEGSDAAKNAVNRPDWKGDTPLHLLATDDGNLAAMALLLRAGAYPTQGNVEGESAVDVAQRAGAAILTEHLRYVPPRPYIHTYIHTYKHKHTPSTSDTF